jgi:hypothetical protein
MTYSPDGRYWWDGQAWQPAISPDGRLRWTGTAWVPIQPVVAQQTVAQPSAWTRPLQLASAALIVVELIWGAIVLVAVLQTFTGSGLDALLPPDATSTMTPSEVEAFRQTMQATIITSVILGVVVGGGFNLVLLIGSVKRWRWVFWWLMIVGFFAAFGLLNIPLSLTLRSVSPSPTFQLPEWVYLGAAPVYLLALGLSIWMVIALRRFGTWACVRVPVS